MGKKRMHPEFHEYVKGLERIKSDVEKIDRIVKSEANLEDRLEDVIPCLKRILERIVYGCLAIQIPVYGKTTSAKRWRNKKASELVREVNPEFYPCPNLDRGVPYIKIANGVRDCAAPLSDCAGQCSDVEAPAPRCDVDLRPVTGCENGRRGTFSQSVRSMAMSGSVATNSRWPSGGKPGCAGLRARGETNVRSSTGFIVQMPLHPWLAPRG